MARGSRSVATPCKGVEQEILIRSFQVLKSESCSMGVQSMVVVARLDVMLDGVV